LQRELEKFDREIQCKSEVFESLEADILKSTEEYRHYEEVLETCDFNTSINDLETQISELDSSQSNRDAEITQKATEMNGLDIQISKFNQELEHIKSLRGPIQIKYTYK
jgi:peptidoglycan hydrolase CwlO-like protein